MTTKAIKKEPPDIFIVYTESEWRLADAIKKLFDSRGQSTFYCREKERPHLKGVGYRAQLAENLMAAKVAILLISPSFKWKSYCQAETGLAMAQWHRKLMNVIPVAIPPVDIRAAEESAPVVEGAPIVSAKDFTGRATFSHILKMRVDETLQVGKGVRKEEERRLSVAVDEAFESIVSSNLMLPPNQELFSIWPPFAKKEAKLSKLHPALDPEDHGLSLSEHSIIERIKKSLSNGQEKTKLDFVGVSLKFSLRLITVALEEFAKRSRVSKPKTLRINLVHMDADSHILQALNDRADINFINENFDADWSKGERQGLPYRWRQACKKASINMPDPVLHRIDYIPPRVGIMIDEEVLFAGRCSFDPHAGGGGYNLLVGEREYFHYSASGDDSRGREAINEFRKYLRAYKSTQHNNGGTLVNDGREWDRRIDSGIEHQPNVRELVLISQSMTKFDGLVPMALRKAIPLKIYVQSPSTLYGGVKSTVDNLKDRLDRHIAETVRDRLQSTIEVYHFSHCPTFRAVLIGDSILAVQVYSNPKRGEETSPQGPLSSRASGLCPELSMGALRLIATQHSTQFLGLKKSLIDDFCNSDSVTGTPIFTWPARPVTPRRSARLVGSVKAQS